MAKGLFDVIKYEGDNRTFIYKYPSEDFNFGTQLIVHQSQEAVLFQELLQPLNKLNQPAKFMVCKQKALIQCMNHTKQNKEFR